jgi:hypothetical protein
MASIGDIFAATDDRVIRLRAEGLTYRQIADRFGLSSASEAQRRYRNARARQIPPEHRPRAYPQPSGLIVAWAAGFFDGEGCVFGYEGTQNGYRRFTFGIQVAQTDRVPLDDLQRRWGGSVRPIKQQKPSHRPAWSWAIRGHDAGVFLRDVRPYLRVKGRAADAAIPCLLGTHSHGIPFTAAEVELRRQAIAVLRDTNHRGEA